MEVRYCKCDNCGEIITDRNYELSMNNDFCSVKCKKEFATHGGQE